jgi:hypothetical protein
MRWVVSGRANTTFVPEGAHPQSPVAEVLRGSPSSHLEAVAWQCWTTFRDDAPTNGGRAKSSAGWYAGKRIGVARERDRKDIVRRLLVHAYPPLPSVLLVPQQWGSV